MPSIDDILKETGEEAVDLAKTNFKELLFQAKDESKTVIKETGEKIEKWLIMRAKGELDDDELESLLNTRKKVVRQFLLTQEIASRARLERISMGLIDIVVNKFIGEVF
jgi:transcription initiation factor IIE alpha subunit